MLPNSNLMSVKFRVPARKLEDIKNVVVALGGQIEEEAFLFLPPVTGSRGRRTGKKPQSSIYQAK